MKKLNFFNIFLVASLMFNNPARSQSDGCTGVPSLTMGSGSCSTTNWSLPGSFSDGGLVNASCAANNDRDDGWFSFTTGVSQTSVNLESTSSNRRQCLSVWTSCAGGTELGCNQQNAGVTATLNLTGLSPSTTYFVQIHRRSGNDGASDNGTICVYEPGAPPLAVPADCNGGTTVCTTAAFSGNSSGSGNITDITAANNGCLSSGEHQSSWYYFKAQTAGTFAFMIQTSVDYDFAVWGPYTAATCPPTGSPLRCSYSGINGNTGLQAGAGDQTEGSGGDAVVDPINAAINDVFVMVIDNYSSDNTSFNLNWTLTNGATLDCTNLPIEMANFTGQTRVSDNKLTWETKSETNSKEFKIERSFDGEIFESIGSVPALENSSTTKEYSFTDTDYKHSKIYYRLKMIDLDLSFEYSHVLPIDRELDEVLMFPNPTNGEISFDFGSLKKGTYLISYINLLGEKVQEYIQFDNSSTIYQSSILADKANGIYFVQIQDNHGQIIQTNKLIKK